MFVFFLYLCKQKKCGMNVTNNLSERLIWLDWMKVWAILSIIWGHFFSAGHIYLYVFNVQVFCVIIYI